MDTKGIQTIDKSELAALIEVARETGNFSSKRLGEIVSNLVKIVICSKEFHGYTEDWQAEMFGEACVDIYSALKNKELPISDHFNYCYTTARNACIRSIGVLKKNTPKFVPEEKADPMLVQDKRKKMRGFFDVEMERKILKCAFQKKQVLIKNAVGRAASVVSENFNNRQLEKLISLARNVRENV